MPESAVASTDAGVEATYKSRDVEGFLDVHFYRKLGFALALFCAGENDTDGGDFSWRGGGRSRWSFILLSQSGDQRRGNGAARFRERTG